MHAGIKLDGLRLDFLAAWKPSVDLGLQILISTHLLITSVVILLFGTLKWSHRTTAGTAFVS